VVRVSDTPQRPTSRQSALGRTGRGAPAEPVASCTHAAGSDVGGRPSHAPAQQGDAWGGREPLKADVHGVLKDWLAPPDGGEEGAAETTAHGGEAFRAGAQGSRGPEGSLTLAANVRCEHRRHLPGSLPRGGGEVAKAPGGAAAP
jgi:hypothetical protein